MEKINTLHSDLDFSSLIAEKQRTDVFLNKMILFKNGLLNILDESYKKIGLLEKQFVLHKEKLFFVAKLN